MREPAASEVFGISDLFPTDEPSASPPPATLSAALAQPAQAVNAEELSALQDRVDRLSQLLDQTRDKLMTEKARITRLQTRIDKLPRR
jgi:hypothetical protein